MTHFAEGSMERKGGLPVNKEPQELQKEDKVRITAYGDEMQCVYAICKNRENAAKELAKLLDEGNPLEARFIQIYIKRKEEM